MAWPTRGARGDVAVGWRRLGAPWGPLSPVWILGGLSGSQVGLGLSGPVWHSCHRGQGHGAGLQGGPSRWVVAVGSPRGPSRCAVVSGSPRGPSRCAVVVGSLWGPSRWVVVRSLWGASRCAVVAGLQGGPSRCVVAVGSLRGASRCVVVVWSKWSFGGVVMARPTRGACGGVGAGWWRLGAPWGPLSPLWILSGLSGSLVGFGLSGPVWHLCHRWHGLQCRLGEGRGRGEGRRGCRGWWGHCRWHGWPSG